MFPCEKSNFLGAEIELTLWDRKAKRPNKPGSVILRKGFPTSKVGPISAPWKFSFLDRKTWDRRRENSSPWGRLKTCGFPLHNLSSSVFNTEIFRHVLQCYTVRNFEKKCLACTVRMLRLLGNKFEKIRLYFLPVECSLSSKRRAGIAERAKDIRALSLNIPPLCRQAWFLLLVGGSRLPTKWIRSGYSRAAPCKMNYM